MQIDLTSFIGAFAGIAAGNLFIKACERAIRHWRAKRDAIEAFRQYLADRAEGHKTLMHEIGTAQLKSEDLYSKLEEAWAELTPTEASLQESSPVAPHRSSSRSTRNPESAGRLHASDPASAPAPSSGNTTPRTPGDSTLQGAPLLSEEAIPALERIGGWLDRQQGSSCLQEWQEPLGSSPAAVRLRAYRSRLRRKEQVRRGCGAACLILLGTLIGRKFLR